MMNIAIVEDEPKLAALIDEYLKKESFTTTIYHNGTDALEQLSDNPPNLILLDLMLPGTDGITVCREIRKTSIVPIIMMTARVEEIDRLLGLEIGADDYICKPYSPREVVARVKAVLRRSEGLLTDTTQVQNDAFVLEENEAQVKINGKTCALTSVELMLLKTMHSQPGRIFNRQQLIQRIYSDNRIVSDRTVDSHVKKLRHKLKGLQDAHEYIQSVYGIGYKFEFAQEVT